MLIVAPNGRTNELVASETPKLLRTFASVTGSVPELERVTNAVIADVRMPLKNQRGDLWQKTITISEYTTIA